MPAPVHLGSTPARRVASLLAALAALFAVLAPSQAWASPAQVPAAPTRADRPAATPNDCLTKGDVWVYVVYSDGSVLNSSCATNFTTGAAALKSAGVDVSKDAKGLICALDSKPDPCPTKFNGQYWNYYSSTDGQKFTYSQKSADESKPAKGSIEAWCYNKASEKSCTPPKLDLTAAVPDAASATPSASPSTAPSKGGSSGTAWGVGIVVAIIVVAAVVLLVVRRRRN